MATLYVDSAAPELLAVSNILRSLTNSPVQFNVRDVSDASASLDDFLKHSPSKEVPVLVADDGVSVGVINVAKALLKHEKATSDLLLGSTAAEQADVEKWVNHCLKELGPTVHKPQERKHLAHLSKLNKTLLPRVFLESSRLTLADLFTYATIHSVVSTFSDKDKLLFHNVIRWFDNIQHLQGVHGVLPVVPVDADLQEKEEKIEEKKAPAKAQPKAKEAAPAPAAPAVEENYDISALEIRVGKILACRKHTEKLYVETIDVGEEKPRNVVSGLALFVPLEQMQGRKVLVLCNLKPAVLVKETSEGMVLAASNHDHTQVELVDPPADAKVGERVTFPGHEGPAAAPIDLRSKQPTAWTKLSPDLKTDASRVARWKGVPFTTSAGTCTVTSLVDAHIA